MKKILIVIADYYEDISLSLLKNAKSSLSKFSLKIIKVPGDFEIPVTISKNIRLFDDDVIYVSKSDIVLKDQLINATQTNLSPDFITVFVSGRVNDAGRITLPQGASLNQALIGAAGPKILRGHVEFVRFSRGGDSERRKFNY